MRPSTLIAVLAALSIGGLAAAQSQNASQAPCSFAVDAVWSHADGGLHWQGEHVSLGEHGTQVFAYGALNNARAMLLSSFDGDPASPVWSLPTPAEQPYMVDSSNSLDIHVAITAEETGVPNKRIVRVHRFSSSSPTPQWTYTYPELTSGAPAVGICDDGCRVLAMVRKPDTPDQWDIVHFFADSPIPTAVVTLPFVGVGGALWDFEVAKQGRHAAFWLGTKAYVYDADTQELTLLVSEPIVSSERAISLSGDGAVVALGAMNGELQVWERLAGAYQKTYTHVQRGIANCSQVAVSKDGSTVAFAYGYPYPSQRVDVLALDVTTKTMRQAESHSTGTGEQNVPLSIAISADGSIFAVGERGDMSGAAPELRVYSCGIDLPIATFDLPGPAWDVDVSADGQWVAAASSSHLGTGGRIDLVRVSGWDLTLLGAPKLGATIDVQFTGTPMVPAWLLISPERAFPSIPFGNSGTLHLDPTAMRREPLGTIPPDGVLQVPWSLPAQPAFLGTSWFLQVLTGDPERQLGLTWLKMTLLPSL